jgi:S-adenosylmethionine decarboxylase
MQTTKRVPRWTTTLPAQKFSYTGIHLIADFWHGKTIQNAKELETLLQGAATAAHSTPLKVSIHEFTPEGITGVIVLAESHIAVHTWPEIEYMAVDVFTCGKDAKPKKALEFLQEALQPKTVKVQELKRGVRK